MNIIFNGAELRSNLEYSNMPKIEGSEKQIAFAEDIRASFARDLNKMIQQIAVNVKCNDPEELMVKIKAQKMDQMVDKIFANVDCKYWIDNRGRKLIDLMKEVA